MILTLKELLAACDPADVSTRIEVANDGKLLNIKSVAKDEGGALWVNVEAGLDFDDDADFAAEAEAVAKGMWT